MARRRRTPHPDTWTAEVNNASSLTSDAPDFARMIDFTILKQDTTLAQIEAHCKTAIEKSYGAVCVPPCYASKAKDFLKGTNVVLCSVVGFPTGMHLTTTKLQEAEVLIQAGVKELDMVMNIALFKSNNYEETAIELRRIRILTQAKGVILKVIIETGLLSEEELTKACEICVEQKADFVKTSTGFVKPGAEIEKVILMRKLLPDSVQIKASGGIRTLEQAQAFIEAGATRIGTSAVL